MSTAAFPTGSDELDYIRTQAAAMGLDPAAVLAVAAHEGVTLPAEVGDYGTSFGPWQLHEGGQLPGSVWARGPDYAQQWANSPAGIDYALQGIRRKVGGSTQGIAEIVTQILNFEQPTNPQPEIAAASQSYTAGEGPSVGAPGTGTQQTSGFAPPAGSTATQAETENVAHLLIGRHITVAQAAQMLGAPESSITSSAWYEAIPGVSNVTNFLAGTSANIGTWVVRGAEILAGLLLVGLALAGVFIALSRPAEKLGEAAKRIPGVG